MEAKRVLPEDYWSTKKVRKHRLWGKQAPKPKSSFRLRFKKDAKPMPPEYKNGAGPVWPAVLLWYVFIPLGIIALFLLTFALDLTMGWLWFLALGLGALWLGISGIVFFPIQYIGLPLGMAGVILGLIMSNPLLLTAGIALIIAATIAFASMALMFLVGTRKYQPKAK